MYGLMVNFGSQPQIPLTRPNPQVLAQLDGRGGSSNETIGSDGFNAGQTSGHYRQDFSDLIRSRFGDLFGWRDTFAAPFLTSLNSGSGNQTLTVSVSGSSASFDTGLSPLVITTDVSTAPLNSQSATSSKFDPVQDLPLLPRAASSRVLQALDNALTHWRSSDRWSLFGDGQDPGTP